ncbi:oxidoreductase htatip2 [Mitosporidium daphniae]|uniref:Oxidoreductase htatip2 n=1 Tax=Mitosporidium daphniae TaxID=1485682 RepID=A0A098VUA4_9MICR|nr:oxidoreductase htatip2 [Mitosporidium daphniae]KGG52374.1 oxidoreductase htatip2 [Mitosporidium daphniae]|eukprot:XP_013238832.1 oxidoreductase htatip2 [Mitosporidium daphniae]
MKAIVIGATGQIGRQLVSALLRCPQLKESRVSAIVRNLPEDPQSFFDATDESISRLSLRVVSDFNTFDFSTIFDCPDKFTHAFSTLGTTLKQSPNAADYYRVDHDFPVKFASAARAGGVPFFGIVTSMNSCSSSSFAYLKLKGDVEKDVIALDFPSLVILRPGFLFAEKLRDTAPWFEALTHKLFYPVVEFFFPMKYTVHIEDAAKTMLYSAIQATPGLKIIENKEIVQMALASDQALAENKI